MLKSERVSAFLEAQELDKETVEYLCSAFEEGGLNDLKELAETFLSEHALGKLNEFADATPTPTVCAPCKRAEAVSLAALAAAQSPSSPDRSEEEELDVTSKPSKHARRQAKAKAKCKSKVKAKAKTVAAEPEHESRELGDVAAFGLAETEEGLDAFDSFAICWGSVGRHKLKNAEGCKDITLPMVYVGIVTELGQKDLINGAQLKIMRGHKYGLVGRNGCGKTTLLRRIARRQLPGLPNLRYGYVAQELVGTETSVLETACTGDVEYQQLMKTRNQIEQRLMSGNVDATETAELTEVFAEVTQQLDDVEQFFGKEGLEGYAREILSGLQFTDEMLDMPTRALSGGWRMRLALAQALLSRADCLLLDEPTNHLDFAGVLWLQHFLKTRLKPDCMLVMISHDRLFLDDVVTDIIEISRQTIEQGPGNYTSWHESKALEREAISSKLEANERERERTKEMISKMREAATSGKKGREADANKLRQAKQREQHLYGKISSSGEAKTYGRLELANINGKKVDIKALAAEKLVTEEKVTIKLPEPELLQGALLQLDGASYTIRETKRVLLKNVKLTLEPKSRVAVVGANGAGKTTLLRWLEGEQWPENKARRHPKLKIAHVSQHHLERLESHLSESCVMWLRGVLPDLEPGQDPKTTLSNVAPDQCLFAFLAKFGIGSIAKQKIGTLSGGQKARLAFAAAVWYRPHLLLLDEPTNHLDIETLESLADALRAFPGAAVIVSHNQGFLAEVCNELWTVDAGKVVCSGRGEGGFVSEFQAYRRKVLKKLKAGGF